jgi:streptogramin lyase
VWVTNRESGTLSKVDPRTDTVVTTVRMPIEHPGGLVAVGRELWIGNDDSAGDTVVVYDTRTGRTRTVRAGTRPAYLTTSRGLVWVSLQGESAVARIDPRTSTVLGTTPAGATPVNLDGSRGPEPEVWVPDDAGDVVTRIDASTGEVIETIPTGSGSGPAVAAVSPIGGAWVTGFGAGVVWWFRPASA